MTFREHQDALRASQQHVLDRPAPAPADPPRTQRRLAMWVGGALLVIGGIALARGVLGAEIDAQRPHEIWALRSGAQYSETMLNLVRIAAPEQKPYPSRADCMIAITGVRIDKLLGGQGGWRLRCEPIDERRVN
jgi:hypothetical protein